MAGRPGFLPDVAAIKSNEVFLFGHSHYYVGHMAKYQLSLAPKCNNNKIFCHFLITPIVIPKLRYYCTKTVLWPYYITKLMPIYYSSKTFIILPKLCVVK